MRRTLCVPAGLTLLLAACGPLADTPSAPPIPAFSKGRPVPDVVARWDFFDTMADGVTQTGVVGDGRDVDGTTTSVGQSSYKGGVCGVHATIFVDGSGDAVIDPDKNFTPGTCGGPARVLTFHLPAGDISAGAFTNAYDVMGLAQGESRLQRMRFWYNDIPDCELLVYDDDPGLGENSAVMVTRTGPVTWIAESTGDHRAVCVNTKGRTTAIGERYFLPLHVQITME